MADAGNSKGRNLGSFGTKLLGLVRKLKTNFGKNQWVLTLFGAIVGAILGAWFQSAFNEQVSRTIVRASLDQADRRLQSGAAAEASLIYEDLLKSVSPNKHELDFAEAQHKLGICHYLQSLETDKYNNLNKAIACQHEALNIYKPDEQPLLYARAHNELSAALASLAEIQDKAKNLTNALESAEEALRFFSIQETPLDYSRAQINKANIFLWFSEVHRQKENLNKSLASANAALSVLENYKDSKEYVRALVCLGNAYGQLAMLDKNEETILLAIDAFGTAKKSVDVERDPYYHARILNNLGVAYAFLATLRGEQGRSDLDKAVSALRDALEIYSDKQYASERARTASGLAEALLALGDLASLEEAVRLLNSSLQVYTLTHYPVKYAETKIALGDAYRKMAQVQEPRRNLESALHAYETASKIFDERKYPLPHKDVVDRISRVHEELENLDIMEAKMDTSS